MDAYRNLYRAQLSAEYLHTNSTTHEFIFGALAELLDNARDAGANKMEVYAKKNPNLRGGYHLAFLDDGCGMNRNEAISVITFGKSLKRGMDTQIGHYGNGLKSGSMRLGNDMILFTKKEDSQSCVFLSRTFLEEEKLDAVLVPIPTFKINTRKPYLDDSAIEMEKFKIEMDIILKYSPFQSEREFFQQFDAIKGNGTLIIIYNMKLRSNGDPELDVDSEEGDIVLGGCEDRYMEMLPEYYSFQKYTSILYHEPRMKIYIQGKKVHTCRLAYGLCKPRSYNFSSVRFRSSRTKNLEATTAEVNIIENKLLEAESKMRQLAKDSFESSQNRSLRAKYNKAIANVSQIKEELVIKKQKFEAAQKAVKEVKNLKFIYGLNITDRRRYGVFIYNCGRLIKMYQRVGPQTDGKLKGILGIVDIPFSVLAPTHNKQDFTDVQEYKLLLRALGEHLEQYWTDLDIDKTDINKFWAEYGYLSENWNDTPSEELKYARKRAMNSKTYIQCDKCLKWRVLPYSSKITKFSSDWSCRMNPDQAHNKCSHLEEIWNCPEGKLVKSQKGAKTKEELENDIKRCEKKLSLLKKDSPKPQKKDNLALLNNRSKSRTPLKPAPSPRLRENIPKKQEVPPSKPILRKDRCGRSIFEEMHKLTSKGSPAATKRKRIIESESEESEEEEEIQPRKRRAAPPKPASIPEDTVKTVEPPKKGRRASSRITAKQIESDDEEEEEEEEEIEQIEKRITSKAGKPTTSKVEKPTTSKAEKPTASKAEKPTTSKAIKPTSSKAEKPTTSKTEKPIISNTERIANTKAKDTSQSIEVESSHASKTKPPTELMSALVPGQPISVLINEDQWLTATVKDIRDSDASVVINVNSELVLPIAAQRIKILESAPEVSSTSDLEKDGYKKIIKDYKDCLCYFLPPNWKADASIIKDYTLQELIDFDNKSFFKKYEDGLLSFTSTMKETIKNAEDRLEDMKNTVLKFMSLVDEDSKINPKGSAEYAMNMLKSCIEQVEKDRLASEEEA